MVEPRNPVGAHVPVRSGLVRSVLPTMREIGAETLQVFLGNPRAWATSPGDPAQDEEFAATCERDGIPAFVHAPYLVNLGSPTAATYERSVASVDHNLARARAIGARGLVVHTGSCVRDDWFDTAMRQVRAGLLPLLDALAPEGPRLLLEPTAGQGRSLCAGIEDLGAYLEVLDRHPMLGVCLDTCHVFAAGAPLDRPGGAAATLDRLDHVAGADRLELVHANDSKDPRGSFRDRHERIGHGRIGADAITELLAHPGAAGVPFVLETPDGPGAWKEDVSRVQQLR